MKTTTFKLSLLMISVSFIILILMDILNFSIVKAIKSQFSVLLQPLVGLSVILVVFPVITIPIIGDIIVKSKEIGVKMNENLLKDYIDSVFVVFSLALAELLIVIIYSLTQIEVIVYVLVSILISLLFVLVVLLLSLWEIIKILYEVVARK